MFLGPAVGLILIIFQWRVGASTERKFEKNFQKGSKYSAIVTNLKKKYVLMQIKGLKYFLAQNYYLFWSYSGGLREIWIRFFAHPL